ncbi:MAG: ABC transporter substrate-binding protein [Lapillicoccus sp.]
MHTAAMSVVVVAGLALSACSSGGGGGDAPATSKATTPALTGKPIIIGLDEDSTGAGASYSVIAGKTIRDAVDEINEKGGILGRPVQLSVANDESDPTKAPSVVRQLIDAGSVALLLQSSSTAVNQAKPIIQQAKIVSVAPTSISQTFGSAPDNDYAYSLANLLNDFVKVYCGAFKAAGYTKLAVLSDASVTIDGVNKLLLPGLQQCITIVAQEKAPLDAADLNAQVSRLKGASPDVILVSSVGGNFEVLAHNTLSQQVPTIQRFSLASIGNQPASWKLASPGALKGLVFMGSIDPNNPRTKTLQQMLSARRGESYTVTAYDAQAYDSVQIIKKAIEKVGSTDDISKIKGAMDAITAYPATFGADKFTLSFGPTKHLGADGLCGLVLTQFGADNKPTGAWDKYQPPC